MIKIALTGGIGTGKTYLSRHFREIGIPVFYADDEAKNIYRDEHFLVKMRKEFPDGALWHADGQLNMQSLKNAFSDKDFLHKLSVFVHPFVMEKFEKWAGEQGTAAVMMESAIVYEYGLEGFFDKIIVADAPEPLRIERVKRRNPELTDEQIRQRMAQQMPQQEKCSRADLVVCTGETYSEAIKFEN